ncbi:MAG TPA: homocysteine S-methyltransferase family protein [Microvirga sp.]|nr:homocysteine S-methyltransferase family protein [Microvirga sp.]
MTRYRHALPQLSRGPFITDGGLETTLVFLEGIDLPCFAAFPLVLTEEGRGQLTRYFAPYLAEAARRGAGIVLDTPTWRANADWGAKLGYGPDWLSEVNRLSVEYVASLRDAHEPLTGPIVINGVVGPRGDGYQVGATMDPVEAERYHALQAEAFRDGAADMMSAITMTYAGEAIGIARAARGCGLPVAISFTLETDGRLPSGQSLKDAIAQTDAATGGYPAYYMINCAHPEHFEAILDGGAWLDRIGGLRANASRKSHAELDAATELDIGDPAELGGQYRALRTSLRRLCVLGGCCGTDHRHIRAICEACLPEEPPRLRAAG